MQNRNRFNYLICVLCWFFPLLGWSQVKLPKLISDGMVLQRDVPLKLWGWAAANEQIKVSFRETSYSCVANGKGEWELTLPAQQAGGPYQLNIQASNTITLQNILIGDVWICSGQSNMEIPMRRVQPLYEKDIATANYPSIRYFEVPKQYDFNTARQDLASGQWKSITTEGVLSFSAIAYFFARELHSTYKVPIGLINTSLGGSPAEAWLSEKALKAFPQHYQEAQRFKDSTLIQQIEGQDRARIQTWYKQLAEKDKGYRQHWKNPEVNTASWPTMNIPGYWADSEVGKINGVVWFRKEISLPASMAGKTAKLNVGRIVDADSVFVNGKFVGTTGYQYPPRWYTIPSGILKAGKNTIVVRVINERGQGGFVPDKPYSLIADGKTIDLTGYWQYQIGAVIEPLASQTFVRWKPGGLYNAMISPLLNYRMKGIIWYQGEANADRPIEYASLFPAMIQDWRKQWNQGDFPFLFVQLANFMEAKEKPSGSNWALLREAQRKTLDLPNTGMAVAIDVGEWNDIHPLNKKDVAHRLALAARKVAYQEKLVSAGPLYEKMQITGNKIILSFTHTGSGLMVKGDILKHFAIAGTDKKYVWAQARIENNKVVVWSDTISQPIAVRYAWADNPERANLYNKEGLPASSFSTENELKK